MAEDSNAFEKIIIESLKEIKQDVKDTKRVSTETASSLSVHIAEEKAYKEKIDKHERTLYMSTHGEPSLMKKIDELESELDAEKLRLDGEKLRIDALIKFKENMRNSALWFLGILLAGGIAALGRGLFLMIAENIK